MEDSIVTLCRWYKIIFFFVKHLQQTAKKKIAYGIGEGNIKKESTSQATNKFHENVSRYLNTGPAEEVKMKSLVLLWVLSLLVSFYSMLARKHVKN